MPQAVILDMDGTLVDSNGLHAESWQRALAKFGINVSFDAVLHQIGKGGDQLVPFFLPDEAERKRIEKPLTEYRTDLFKREYMPRVKPFPRVRELIQKIRDSGMRVALASSAKKDELEQYKKIAQIDDLIEKETTSNDAEKSKPYPDIFSAALGRLGIPASEAIAIGDTPYDAESAGRAGMGTIGLTSGGWTGDELKDAGCVEVYRDAADLLAHFSESALLRGERGAQSGFKPGAVA